jgi:hypothetical protein
VARVLALVRADVNAVIAAHEATDGHRGGPRRSPQPESPP